MQHFIGWDWFTQAFVGNAHCKQAVAGTCTERVNAVFTALFHNCAGGRLKNELAKHLQEIFAWCSNKVFGAVRSFASVHAQDICASIFAFAGTVAFEYLMMMS